MSNDRGEIIIEERVLAEGFTPLPNVILLDRGVSYGAKQAYGLLLHYSWRYRGFPGQTVMAADMAATERTVRKYLKELEEVGLVTIRQLGLGRPNTYILHSVEKWAADRKKSSGLAGKKRPVQAEEIFQHNDNTENQEKNEDESPSFFQEIGERYGRNAHDRKALAKSLAKWPEEAVRWAVEQLEDQDGRIENPAAWLNAVVPALASELAERREAERSRERERLVVIRSTARFYDQAHDPRDLQARLLETFPGEEELVTQVLREMAKPPG